MPHTVPSGDMLLQNWWYTTLLNSKTDYCPPLKEHMETDVLVVGAGMAGLHAALRLVEAGKNTVLVERNICGGSSTGKSAGFLTPDSELELHQILRRYGLEDGAKVWNIAVEGVKRVVANVTQYQMKCDLLEQDSLFVGLGKAGKKSVYEEAAAFQKIGYPTQVYEGAALKRINPGKGYMAGIRTGKTYAVNPLLYAQELKRILVQKGVRIYEGTPVTHMEGHKACTHMGSVTSKNIIFCIDKMRPTVSRISEQVYHAQTFLTISEPLDPNEIKQLFPEGDFMCWDSKLVYSYYRLTGDKRILLGGGSPLTTFLPLDVTSPTVIKRVIRDFKNRFPFLKHQEFMQYWPGRIDTTKDLVPIVTHDPKSPYIQYVLGCVGLPWATFCGDYAARKVLDPTLQSHDKFLRIDRPFFVPMPLQKLMGKMTAFSFNILYSKYFQKNRKRSA